MPLRLHKTTHNTKGTDGLIVFGEESGDDRVVRFFGGSETIGRFRIHAEVVAAVVKRNSRPRNDKPGAESHIVTLNHGDHIALSIRRRQIDGAALRRRSRNGIKGAISNQAAAFVGVGL